MAEMFISHKLEVKAALDSQIARAAEILRGMMESNAKQHITRAVYDTPSTWYVRTGLLRNSITAQVTKDGGDTCVVVGTNVEYAPYVELGTGVLGPGGGHGSWTYMGSDGNFHTTSGMAPRPYLRPAVENHKSQYMNVLKNELRG